MPALQVRDFPDDLYDELREYAARNHRSIAQQTIACVESELRRSKTFEEGADAASRSHVIDFLPSNIQEAWARAQLVNPFGWLDALGIEPDEACEARLRKRKQWKREIDELHKHWRSGFPGEFPAGLDVADMIREEREARDNRIVANVEGYISRKEAHA